MYKKKSTETLIIVFDHLGMSKETPSWLTTIKEITDPIEISVHSHTGDRTEIAITKARAIMKEMAKTVRGRKKPGNIPHLAN
jgi:hypothetical protein